jgi:hypothetical protein
MRFGNAVTALPIVALKVVDFHFLGSFAMEGSYRCMLNSGGNVCSNKSVVALSMMVWLQQDSFCLRH